MDAHFHRGGKISLESLHVVIIKYDLVYCHMISISDKKY